MWDCNVTMRLERWKEQSLQVHEIQILYIISIKTKLAGTPGVLHVSYQVEVMESSRKNTGLVRRHTSPLIV